MRRLGLTKQLTHLAYDMVTGKEGTMSSRTGNVILFETIRDQMIEKLIKETKERHPDWTERKVFVTAKTLALSSIAFIMLRQDPKTIIAFDPEEAMSFDGFTAPYILYTVARLESLRKKTRIKPKLDVGRLTNVLEKRLFRALGEFPQIVQEVGGNFQISAIAAWAYNTSKLFAEYYHRVRITDEPDKQVVAARLALCQGVRTVLINAMNLLGIEVLKEM